MPTHEERGQDKQSSSKDKQGQQHGADTNKKGGRTGKDDKPRNPGNFANDPQRAREAGQKGGQSR